MVVRGESEGRRSSRFSNTRVVVTGGSQGIGREIATAFAAEGACVAVLDRLIAEATVLANAIGGSAVECDLADAANTEAAITEAIAGLGGIDVLVNNAGVFKI